MRKGAIPVPQTVALVLGVAIIAVLGYWFFFLSGRAGGEATDAFCQSKLFAYCTEWAAKGYSETNKPRENMGWGEYSPECAQRSNYEANEIDANGAPRCKRILP